MLLKVKDVMVKDLVTVGANENIRKAVEKMNHYEIGCLIVVDKENIVGILTERDILKRVIVNNRSPNKTFVSDIMSRPLTVVDPEASLEEAAKLMFEKRIKKLPVIRDKKLVGLVTLTDIARFHSTMAEFIKNLAAKYDLPKRMEKVIRYYIV